MTGRYNWDFRTKLSASIISRRTRNGGAPIWAFLATLSEIDCFNIQDILLVHIYIIKK